MFCEIICVNREHPGFSMSTSHQGCVFRNFGNYSEELGSQSMAGTEENHHLSLILKRPPRMGDG